MDTSNLKYYDKRDIYNSFNNKNENKYYDKRKQSPPPDHITFNVHFTAVDPSGPQKLHLTG